MKKKAFRIFLVFMALMFLLTLLSRGIYAYTLPRVTTTSFSNIALDHSVKGDGTVEKKKEEPVCVPAGIRIDEICVEEGQTVKEGSTLLRLNEEDLKEYIASLQTSVSTLSLQLSDLQVNDTLAAAKKQKEIDRASKDYTAAAASLDRKISDAGTDLQKATEERDHLGSKDSYQSSVSGNDSSDEWESLYKPLEDAQSSDSQSSAAKATSLALTEKKKELEKYQSLLKSGTDITSTINGMVSSIPIKPGDKTPENACLLIAEITDQLTLRTVVSKEDQKNLAIGDPVTLSFHNGKDETEDAAITSITQLDSDTEHYQVDISFDSSLASIGEGGSFSVKSFSENRSVCLPLSAIHSDGMSYYVYLVNRRNSILGEELTITQRRVSIVDKNTVYAALDNSGLTADDSIVISSTKPLADGKTVRLLEE